MPARQAIPFNIYILLLTPPRLQGLKPVRELAIFDGSTGNFNEDGLFSPSIFGKVGTELRLERFSYIDIKINIFHPVIYNALIAMKGLYEEIIAGTAYANWNPNTKDFDRSDVVNGKTGFGFFLKYWKEINFVSTGSTQRDENIAVINKYKDSAMMDKVVVIPAGLRDIEIGSGDRISQDDINDLYRKLLSISNTINESVVKVSPDLLNVSRLSLQRTYLDIYNNITERLEGKHKLIMGKWASRRIMNGTANVITAMDTATPYLNAAGNVSFNDTLVGLYQAMKAVMPVARYHIRNGFLSKVFVSPNMPVTLVDKKTLRPVQVPLEPMYHDRYATDEGIEKVITAFADSGVRNIPLEIKGYYVGLLYRGPDGTFKIIQDIESIPGNRSKADVTPLTFAQLLYIAVYRHLNNYPVLITRYPIAGIGSIYPSMMYVKTTIKYENRRELGDSWEPLSNEYIAPQFPTDGPYLNSVVPHPARIAGLVADYDGDRTSVNALYSDEALNEIKNFLDHKRSYIGTDGKFSSSISTNTIELVLANMTGDITNE